MFIYIYICIYYLFWYACMNVLWYSKAMWKFLHYTMNMLQLLDDKAMDCHQTMQHITVSTWGNMSCATSRIRNPMKAMQLMHIHVMMIHDARLFCNIMWILCFLHRHTHHNPHLLFIFQSYFHDGLQPFCSIDSPLVLCCRAMAPTMSVDDACLSAGVATIIYNPN